MQSLHLTLDVVESSISHDSLWVTHVSFFKPSICTTLQDIIDEVNHLNEKPLKRDLFAVESPDGDYDGRLAEELAEVAKLVDAQANSAEDASAILRDRASSAKILAVDGPDGEVDSHYAEEMIEIANLIDAQAESAEDATTILANRVAAAKIVAVEGPDGEVDGHTLEEMEEIKHIIDDAAKFEDREAVEKKHEWEKKEQVEAEKHPEHDW